MAATIPTNGLGVDAGLDIAGGNLTFTTADKGVHLGVTSATAANLLDDYEEGTWTPTLAGATSGQSGVNFGTDGRVGIYEKVGRTVHVRCYINQSSSSDVGSGTLKLTGLPFTASSTGGVYASITVGYSANWSEAPSHGYVENNNTFFYLLTINSTSNPRSNVQHYITAGDMSGDETVMCEATYSI